MDSVSRAVYLVLVTEGLLVVLPANGPIWRQIEEGIRRMIASRNLRPGEPAPSVRKLARTLGVTPATIEHAYHRLIALGLLFTKRGRGTFVSEAAAPPMSEREKLLEDAAADFATTARSVGAPLDEANHELAAAYTRLIS